MGLAMLDLITQPQSSETFLCHCAMRTFVICPGFESKVRMEADLADAELNSDDIAYFAPELADWKNRSASMVK